jgi:hypothetical protein
MGVRAAERSTALSPTYCAGLLYALAAADDVALGAGVAAFRVVTAEAAVCAGGAATVDATGGFGGGAS